MAGIGEGNREGPRKRSFSESDSEKISGLSLDPNSRTNQNPDADFLSTNSIYCSNPDLYSTEDLYIETPVGGGRGTRLQLKKSDQWNLKHDKAVKDCNVLIKDIEKWITELSQYDSPSLDLVYDGFMKFKKRIARTSQEALIRLVDRRIVDHLASLQIRIESIRKRAERRDRNKSHPNLVSTSDCEDNNVLRTTPPIENRDLPIPSLPDEVFHQPDPIQGIQSLPDDPNLIEPVYIDNPPLENETPLILNPITNDHEIIEDLELDNPIDLDNSSTIDPRVYYTTPPSYQQCSPPPPLSSEIQIVVSKEWESALIRDKDEMLNRIKLLEVKTQDIVASQTNQDRLLSTLEQEIIELSSSNNDKEYRLGQVEKTVERIDKNVKVYIDRKVKELSSNIESVKNAYDTQTISGQIKENVKEILNNSVPSTDLNELRREVESIKHKTRCDGVVLENMRTVVTGVKDQLDRTLESPLNFSSDLSNSLRVDRSKKEKERELIKSAIDSSANLLKQLIDTKISENSDLAIIKKCNSDVKKVTGYSKSCHDLLMKYVSYDDVDSGYYSVIKSLLDSANEWTMNVEQIYSSSEAHASCTVKGDLSMVGIFSNNAKKSIYEFVEDLEIALVGWGSNKQRAMLVFSKHLTEDIKAKCLNISDDYQKLKSWLFKEFGSPHTIVSDIISELAGKPKPNHNNDRQRYEFYADITLGIARLDRLARVPNVNIDELDSILYSRTTLLSLFKVLPIEDSKAFNHHMEMKRLDWKNPQGARTFAFFKELCEAQRNILEPYKGINIPSGSPPRPKSRTVFNVNQGQTPPPHREVSAHAARFSPQKNWSTPGSVFPCPLSRHSHEMNECNEFFSMNPHVRWEGTAKGKICYCCLRPKTTCRDRKCIFVSSVPEVLICQGCREYATEKGLAPFSIMYCRKIKHGPTRAPYHEIRDAFEKYMGKFPQNLPDDCIKYSVNFAKQVFSLAPCSELVNCECCEKPSELSIDTPTIDTESGIKVPTRLERIVPEINEQSAYLMQILKIGTENVLTFFDSGANTNLVNGELALDQNLEIITKKPTKLTVVGGGTITTEMGKFRFNLGPTESGEFHEIKCQGINSVTSRFARYDLSEINDEFRSNKVHPYKGEILPQYAAGDEVKLLIGIKNNHLNPTLVTVLPSGVGVYKSPFKDIFGSRIIYAGPHHVFSKANSNVNKELSHAVFHMRESTLNYQGRTKDIHLAIPIDKRFNISINPTPLPESTLLEMGGEIAGGGGFHA